MPISTTCVTNRKGVNENGWGVLDNESGWSVLDAVMEKLETTRPLTSWVNNLKQLIGRITKMYCIRAGDGSGWRAGGYCMR
jgi:hypothetical protein